MKIKPIFAWYDFWIGIYYDRKNHTLYVLPVPCLGIVIQFKNKIVDEFNKYKELHDVCKLLYAENVSYIKINNLGDIHHNESMKRARDILFEFEKDKEIKND